MLFPSLGCYMLKNTNDISFFLIIPIGAIRYSVPIRLVPTYILLTKEIRLLGKFQPDSFKTLIKNIYTLWGRKRLLHKLLTEIIIPSARV